MPPPRFNKALVNENKHPHVVELAVVTDGMDVELSRQIVRFHKSRHIQPRHGRTIVRLRGIFIGGVFPICRSLATLSKSLAQTSANRCRLNFDCSVTLN